MALRTQVPPLFKLQKYCSICRDSHVNLLIDEQGACKLWEHLGIPKRRQAYVATWKGQSKTFLLTEDTLLPDKMGFERKYRRQAKNRDLGKKWGVRNASEGGWEENTSGCSFVVVNFL